MTDTSGLLDHGLNQDAWQGLQDSLADGSVSYAAYIESVDVRDYEKNVDRFITNDYDVVITIGMGQNKQTLQAARRNPDTIFIGLDQTFEEELPNLHPMTFPEDQMGFFAGSLAAMLSKTRVVGAVCETPEIDSMWRYCEGFRNGARYQDENINALVLYRENNNIELFFNDPDWGEGAAQNLIRRGADVIFGAGRRTGQAALVAAADMNIFAIGSEQDQWYPLPPVRPVLVTSVHGAAKSAIHELMRSFGSGITDAGTVSGAFSYAPFHNLDPLISDTQRDELSDLARRLMTGELDTAVPDK